MNAIETITLLAVIGTLIFLVAPHVARWWDTKRPTPCPACHAWKPVEDMTYIRHNSGTHVRVCEDCCRNLYAPFSSRKQSNEDEPR
jgi:hypothetical protein